MPSSRGGWSIPIRQTALGLLITVIACQGDADPDPPPTITVRDSGGIPVVFNPPPTSDTLPPRGLSETPVASIGSGEEDAAYSLYDVSGGALLADGRIVLANTGTHELRFYDSTGAHLRSVGREGSGPGEFRLLNWGGTIGGDSIVAVDPLLKKATIYDSAGSYGRTFTLPDAVTRRVTPPLGVLSDGGILFTPTVRDSEPPAAPPPTTGIERRPREAVVARAYRRADTIGGRLPGVEWYRDVEKRTMLRVPLGRRLHGAAAGRRIALGDDDAFRIHVYDDSYRLLTVVARDGPARSVTDDDYWAAADAGVLAEMTMPSERAHFRRLLEELPRPDTWPRFLALRLDREGKLWVRESAETEGEVDLWSVFDPDGRLAGRVRVPEGFEILDIRDARVLGVIEDEMGVERAEVYRIVGQAVAGVRER